MGLAASLLLPFSSVKSLGEQRTGCCKYLGALYSHRGLLGGSQQRFLSYLEDAEINDELKAPRDNELTPPLGPIHCL